MKAGRPVSRPARGRGAWRGALRQMCWCWDARGKERKIRVYLLGFGLGQVDECSAAEVDKPGGRTGE